MSAHVKTTSKNKSRVPSGLLFRLAVSLLLIPLSAGCGARSAVGVALHHASSDAAAPRSAKDADDVEVWLDAAPSSEFVVVGELRARAVDTTVSIDRMRERAAELGFDGIYWIECASACGGSCKAKAFVYGSARQTIDGTEIASR